MAIAPPVGATLVNTVAAPLGATSVLDEDEDIAAPTGATPVPEPPVGATPTQVLLPQPQPRQEEISQAGPSQVDLSQPETSKVGVATRFGTRQEQISPEEVIERRFEDAVVERTAAETKKYEDEFGLMERISIRAGKGDTRGTAAAMLREMARLQEFITGLQNEEEEALQRQKVLLSPKGALGPDVTAEDKEKNIQALQARYDAIEQEYMFVAEVVMNPTSTRFGVTRNVPEHPAMLAIQQATAANKPELVNRLIREFLIEVMAEVTVPSITQAGPAQILAPGGAALAAKLTFGTTAAARVGFVTAGGFVAHQVESDASFSEFLQENGVDITDVDKIKEALSDPDLIAKGRTFAKRRGLSVAMWQMASFYLASKTIMPPGLTNKFARKIFNAGAQAVQQVGSEAAGEFQAQVASGQEISGTDIKLEAIGGLQGAITEPIIFQFADRFGGKPTDYATVEAVLEAFVKNPEMTVQEALTALQEVASKGTTKKEAVKLLNSIPGVTLDLDVILSDQSHTRTRESGVKGFQESKLATTALRKTLYATTSGELVDGNAILEGEKNTGTVYWSTDRMPTTTGEEDVSSISATIKALDNLITKAELDLNVALSQGGTSSTQLNIISDEIETLKEKKAQTLQDSKIMGELRPQLHKLLQEMVTLFMPNQDILVIEDAAVRDALAQKGVLGSSNVSRSTLTGKKTQLLYLNTQAMLDLTEMGRDTQRPGTGRPRNFAAIASVMGHEFGHTLAMVWFNDLPAVVREALQAEHRNWLARTLEKNKEETLLRDITGSKANKVGINFFDPNFDDKIPIRMMFNKAKRRRSLEYHLSFTEFVADLMARQMQTKSPAIIAPLTRKFLPRLQTLMRRYFQKYQAEGVFPADETYGLFLQVLKSNAQVQQMEEIKSQFGETELIQPSGSQAENVFRMLNSKHLDIPTEIQDEVMANLDTYNKFMRYSVTLLQLGKENKHIPGLQDYIRAVHEHWITKSNWNDQAMQTMNAWRKLGKTGDELGRFLLELTVKSDELGHALTADEIETLLKEKKIDFGDKAPEAWAVYERVKGDLANSLQELYLIEKERINQDWADIKTIRDSKINELDRLFTKLRNRNYFPLSRFGTLGITVKANEPVTIAGKSYAKNEVVHMELYENKRQRNKGIGTLRRKYGPKTRSVFFAVDEDMLPFTGLPIAVMRQLKQNNKLGLTPEQKIKLQDMIDVMSPTQSIAKRMLERKGTAGFSLDAQRGYGNYMLMMGGHIAKMRHVGQMDAGIESVKRSATYLGQRGIINDKRNEIAGHLTRHKDYLLNPVSEFGGMRALAFLWFLGYNVKSAIVNLTQVLLVAYPYLAARAALTGGTSIKNDARAIAAIVKNMKELGVLFTKNISKMGVSKQEMYNILQAEGIIDESLATELATVAHGDLITKYMPKETAFTTAVHRRGQDFLRGSTWMFQAAEKYNRRVVAGAAYDLAIEQGMNQQDAITEAREAIRTTQFEYARWNRAAFMRGKAGVFFVFMQYLQNVLYFVTRDPGKTRYMLMMFMAAGLQGLPGAEDFLDFLDFGGNKLKKWTGSKRDPRTDVREDLRRMIMTLHASPELIMHGLSAQSFGLGLTSVNDMLGTSLPSLSFENSISAGRVIPGWEGLMKFFSGGDVGQAGQISMAKDILGAAITIPINILQWRMDPDPSELRAFERMAPSVIKGGTRAFRIANGANEEGISTLTGRRGDTIVDFDMGNFEHIGELIGMSLGAVPTRVQRVQEAKWAEKEALQFYKAMRQRLQTTFNYAMEEKRKVGDTQAVKDARKAIDHFNSIAPKGQELINFPEAYFNYRLSIERDKRGVGNRLFDQPVRDSVQETFPAATEERIK